MSHRSIPAATMLLAIVAITVGCASTSPSAGRTVILETNPEPPSAMADNGSFATVPISEACDDAMADAAAVPLSQINDDEFAVTVNDCLTADEWASALYRYPDALGLTNLTDFDVKITLETVCWNSPNTPAACADAIIKGHISG